MPAAAPQRRKRQWRAARDALEDAAARFDALGSPGWADVARAELARIGGRKPRADGPTGRTEEQVARLAAEGHTNKEIALVLFVTVHTVEAHLSSTYAKLGVRSRAHLAERLRLGNAGNCQGDLSARTFARCPPPQHVFWPPSPRAPARRP